ncbi:MAG: exo-alpha-sialidase [Opitutales bacterium]|nr:exo-alpha-sialidase [Opitutales bacterium]
MNDSDFRWVDDPSPTFAGNGDVIVVWVDQAAQEVMLQRVDGNGEPRFPEPTVVSGSPSVFSWLPRVSVNGDGNGDETVHVLWQEILFTGGSHGGEILYARSTDGGKSFSSPLNLSNTQGGAGKGRQTRRNWHNGSLDLLAAADGTVFAAWTEFDGGLFLSRSDDGGSTFHDPVQVGGDDRRPARGPALALASDGILALAWTVGETVMADIQVAFSNDGGKSFSEPVVPVEDDMLADAPKLVFDAEDRLHFVFARSRGFDMGSSEVVHVSVPLYAPNDVSEPVVVASGGAGFPDLAIDRDDRLHLLWNAMARGVRRPAALHYQRMRVRQFDSDGPVVLPGSDEIPGGGLQGLLMRKIALGPDDAVAVVHSFFDGNDNHSGVLLWHLR